MKITILSCIILFLWNSTGSKVKAQSPYISKVVDFMPAPGQFVNQMPAYIQGDTKADMIRKVENAVVGNNQEMISLGGYGGYVVVGFDHMIESKPGFFDFKILGNAFTAEYDSTSGKTGLGGSCEPGIVMVAYDANGNGIPDEEEWYELAGSEYYKPETIRDYKITYYKPGESEGHASDNESPSPDDTSSVKWVDNQGREGYISQNTFHTQPYYPQWIEEGELVFEGTKLVDNAVDESGVGTYYVLYAYHWGYADNHTNDSHYSNFDISWAVDKAGNPVKLPGIHFIKVYTGLNQYCKGIGETSTEISGAVDLHAEGTEIEVPVFVESVSLDCQYVEIEVGEVLNLSAAVYPADATYQTLKWKTDTENIISVNESGQVTAWAPGTAVVTVITGDGYYMDACEITVTESGQEPQPGTGIQVPQPTGNSFISTGGKEIILHGLEGYNCALISPKGEILKTFRVTSATYALAVNIPSGIYLISACKEKKREMYKLIIP